MPKAPARPSPVVRLASAIKSFHPLHFSQAHEREIFGVLALGAAAFYGTALATFSPLDPSWVAVSFPTAKPLNLAGTLGANLSGGALYFLGWVAWLPPVPLVATALLVARRSPAALALSRLLGWVLGAVCLATALAMKGPALTLGGFELPRGGLLGEAVVQRLDHWLGRVGGLIVIATVLLTAGLLVARRAVLGPLWTWLLQGLAAFDPRPWWRQRREEGQSAPARTEEAEPDLPSRPTVPPYRPAPLPLVEDHSAGLCAPEPSLLPPDLSPLSAQEETQEGAAPVAPMPPWGEPLARPAGRSEEAATYAPPPLSVFNKADQTTSQVNPKELEATAALLVKTFEDFGVQGKIIGYQPGPVVTVYEYQPDAGVKQSKVIGLIDDLALALKVDSIFIHPVRGKSALGVQVPNSKREPVHLGDIIGTPTFRDATSPLTFGLGKTISGQPMCTDLTAMPHLLVAGATGSGKSVGINALLCSIIMKATPDEVRMILVDPKMLELSVYEGIPHLLMPVITEPTKASLALKWAASEMERRYKLMQLACVRNIEGFNEFWRKASEERKAQLRTALDDEKLGRLPYILLVIDELADLMMTAPKDVEAQIQRLAQKARASGIHMVLATQRPSVDIITGVIKANLPCRIAYQVVSKHDSRTILDLIGAEKLLGKGDLLFQRPGIGRLERLQGALITDEEVLNLVANLKASSTVRYDEAIINWIDDEYARQKDGEDTGEGAALGGMEEDPKFAEAVAIARAHGVVSASFLQRHLKIGYNRAARMVEFMEAKGLVDKADGAKPRRWLGVA